MQKMNIGTVLFDQSKGAAVVTLVEEQGARVLPIFIGIWEGMAIFRELNRTPDDEVQGVADLVPDAGGEATERGQALLSDEQILGGAKLAR